MIKKMLTSAILMLTVVTLAWAAETYPDISQADLQSAIAAGNVVLLDCNGTESYEKGHLPGALDYQSVSADLQGALPADKGALVVAYCGGPKCNAYKKGAGAAAALGYSNVKHYSGGLSGWSSAKLPLEK